MKKKFTYFVAARGFNKGEVAFSSGLVHTNLDKPTGVWEEVETHFKLYFDGEFIIIAFNRV